LVPFLYGEGLKLLLDLFDETKIAVILFLCKRKGIMIEFGVFVFGFPIELIGYSILVPMI
jgi:hypothetical protein